MSYDVFEPMDAIRFGWNGLKNNLQFFLILMIIVAVLYNIPSILMTFFIKLPVMGGMLSPQIFLMIIPLAIVSMIIYLTVELGLLKIALNFRDNKHVAFDILLQEYPLLLKYLGAAILFGLMCMLPFVVSFAASIIPVQGILQAVIVLLAFFMAIVVSVYLFLKYQFFGYLIVDRGMGPVEALRQSARLTDGALKNLLVFWLELICGIFVVLIVLGMFIALPVGIVLTMVSRDLVPFFSMTTSIISSAINLFVVVPITKLATADIYRRLVARSLGGPAATGAELSGEMHLQAENSSAEGQ